MLRVEPSRQFRKPSPLQAQDVHALVLVGHAVGRHAPIRPGSSDPCVLVQLQLVRCTIEIPQAGAWSNSKLLSPKDRLKLH